MARGQKLAEIRIDQRQLGANADAGEKPRHDQHRDIRAERAEKCERRIDAEIDEKRRAAAVHIGKPAEQRRPEEHPDETRRDDRWQRGTRQLELLREHGGEHTRQEDVEQIEERPDARDDGCVAVKPCRRKTIQSRGD